MQENDRSVIGVAELCNKTSGLHFTKFDEEIALAFSAYCGLSILHSLMYKKLVKTHKFPQKSFFKKIILIQADAQHRSKLSNELMMYHMKVRKDLWKI